MTSNDYDVLNLEQLEQNPYCVHGPTVLFANKLKKFYACSACRDHKLCSFYAVYDENKKFSQEKLEIWKNVYTEFNKANATITNEIEKIKTLPESKRIYCQTCNQFISDLNKHLSHQLVNGISDTMLKKPIKYILDPLISNSSNAQFIFDDSTIDFFVNLIKEQSFDSVMCIGTPSIFEKLQEFATVKRVLMDIDERFARFYDSFSFIRYNMFNNHFFDSNQKENYLKFIRDSKKLLIFIDPPYGGIVKLIANTIQSIRKDVDHNNVSIILIYPYFIEKWITNWLPDLKMIDFKISYKNQKKFTDAPKKGSPARIFTNINQNEMELPFEDGYTYCNLCRKYTYKENKHCFKCNKCSAKDGGVYKHCDKCNKCVKLAYNHCLKCNLCHLESSSCNEGHRSAKRKINNNKLNHNKKSKN